MNDATPLEAMFATITEKERWWLLTGLPGLSGTYGTATEAEREVREYGARLAQRGLSTIITITWETTSAVGRSVARVVAGVNR